MAMGVALWLLCGVAAFAAARAVPPGRPAGFAGEFVTALLIAFGAGLAATALDFGGWNEVDWRAGAFTLIAAFAALGAGRLVRFLTRRVA
jgi:hypothetical protein